MGWLEGTTNQLNGHESEQTPRESEREGSLAYCITWSPKESNMTLVKEQHIFIFVGRILS